MNIKQLIAFFSTTLILLSCAQIVPLSGGDKDVEPPKEVESIPKNGSINFTEKTIVIEFDEFVKLTNVTSQLIVSPLMETPPTILVKGKKLVIKIESELIANTTYSINFGNAITDITEFNVFPNYKYVFSTGTFIDSLSYSGTVVNAFDLSKTENTYVLLYDQFEDSVPYKELPRYVALSDKEGKFSITNIANGQYKFFAINDINGNYLFDLPEEEIGYSNEVLTIDSSSSDHVIQLFEEEGGVQYIDKAENKIYGKIDVVFNLPTKNLTINTLMQKLKTPWYETEISENGDSISLWLKSSEDMETLELVFNDGNEFIDTTEIRLISKVDFKDTLLQISTNITPSFDLNKNISLITKRPTISMETEAIKLFEDSIEVTFEIEKIKGSKWKSNLVYPFKENTYYRLFMPPGTFEDIYGLKNDTVNINFKTKSESDYGILFLNIVPNFTKNYIVQLFKKKKLIKEIYVSPNGGEEGNTTKIDYHFLSPGQYQLKLIVDANGDKKWNTGNYLNGLQPEKVIFFEKEIKMRANWDNDIIWTINE